MFTKAIRNLRNGSTLFKVTAVNGVAHITQLTVVGRAYLEYIFSGSYSILLVKVSFNIEDLPEPLVWEISLRDYNFSNFTNNYNKHKVFTTRRKALKYQSLINSGCIPS